MTSLSASLKLRDQFTATLKKIDSGMQQATKSMENFKKKAAGPAQALHRLGAVAQTVVSKWNNSIKSGMSSASNVVQSSTTRILSIFGKFGNRISSVFSSAFNGIKSKFSSIATVMGSAMSSAKSKVVSGFSAATNAVKNGVSRIGGFLKQSGNAFKQYGQDVKNSLDRMKNSASSASGGFKSMLSAIGVARGISSAFNMVKNSVGGAIERFDTLNQFPKMMQAIGFSAVDAARSKDALVKGIDGLPTTLGDVVSNTQRLAIITHDIDGATKTTLSLNNAFLASGTDSERAADGFYQYSKMLGRGKVDMQSWMSLQATMGPALSDLANAFGFAGKSAQNDLYDALQKGSITFDQFNSKLIKLYDTGTAGAKKALIGSEGIKTSFKNIRSAITNGVEGSIRKIDSLFEKIFGKSIAQGIDGMKQKIKGFFAVINGSEGKKGLLDRIPGLIQKAQPYIKALKKAFTDIKQPMVEAFTAIKNSLGKLMSGFGGEKSVKHFTRFLDTIVFGVKKIAGFIEKHSDTIVKFIPLLLKLAGAFIGFKIGKGLLGPLFNFGAGLFGIVKATGKLGGGLGKAFFGLFKKLPKMPKNPLGDKQAPGKEQTINPFGSIIQTFHSFTKGAAKLALVFGVIKLVEEAAEALKQVNEKVPGNFASLCAKLLNMGLALIGMGAFVAIAGKFAEKNPVAAIAGLIFIAAITLELMLAAEAMKQINDKVPNNMADFATKLANIGIAIGAMAIVVAAIGALVSTGVGALIAIAGLVAIAAICGELMLAAEAMKQINDKVPSNIGDFAAKLANIGIAIGGMAIVVTAVGALMATGIGALIAGAGLATIAAVCGELILVAEAIQQLNDKVPDDLTAVKSKIKIIALMIQTFTESNLGSITDTFKNIVGVIDTEVVIRGIQKFITLADTLERFQNVSVPTGTKEKLKEFETVLQLFGGTKLSKLINDMIQAADLDIVTKSFSALIHIGKQFKSLAKIKFNPTLIKSSMDNIKEIIDYLSDGSGGIFSQIKQFFSSSFDLGVFTTANEAFAALVKVGHNIKRLGKIHFDEDDTIKKVDSINKIIHEMGTAGLTQIIDTMLKQAELSMVKGAIEAMCDLVAPINKLAEVSVKDINSTTNIEAINQLIEEMGSADIGEWFGQMMKANELGEVKNAIEAMRDLIAPMNQFAKEPISDGAIAKVEEVKEVIQKMNDLPEVTGIAGMEGMSATFVHLTKELNGFQQASEVNIGKLGEISQGFNNNMNSMKQSVITTMTGIKADTMAGMMAFNQTLAMGMNQAKVTVQNGNQQIISAFTGLRGPLFSAGLMAMSGLTAGIQAGSGAAINAARSVAHKVASTVKNALEVRSPSRVLMRIGHFISEGLAKGIIQAQNLVQRASDSLAQVAIPNKLVTVSTSGEITNAVHLDDTEISRLQASANQKILVENKQVVPQVTVIVENNDNHPLDENKIADNVASKIMEAMDTDLG
ncbi:tape measure protein [Listeria monocytogenes]|nr:tape measure protein [Listeria monocytogenes]